MGKIFCLVGKSASGKDTIYKNITEKYEDMLEKIVIGTTRPMRTGETNGVDYYFFSDEELEKLEKKGKVIEKRCYNTMQGIWSYFTLAFDICENKDYIIISTLEGAHSITNFYGEDKVCVVYLKIDDRERLLRCIDRESKQTTPDYSEVCRRFIADQNDFSDKKLAEFNNLCFIDSSKSLDDCVEQWSKIYDEQK